ncbi:hypothetical protein EDC96DRAFT_547204 [Choanephora cucurbitarum]|nr:hypothetical protein EDC96DRAFT_547204 [Choanephora cucurbitarum]
MPFQMHGQMYLMQGPFFYLKKDKYTRYAQLYILGPQLPTSLGASNNRGLDRKITSNLDVLSTEVPFVGLFKAVYELFMNAESIESLTLFVWTYPSTRITLVSDVKIQVKRVTGLRKNNLLMQISTEIKSNETRTTLPYKTRATICLTFSTERKEIIDALRANECDDVTTSLDQLSKSLLENYVSLTSLEHNILKLSLSRIVDLADDDFVAYFKKHLPTRHFDSCSHPETDDDLSESEKDKIVEISRDFIERAQTSFPVARKHVLLKHADYEEEVVPSLEAKIYEVIDIINSLIKQKNDGLVPETDYVALVKRLLQVVFANTPLKVTIGETAAAATKQITTYNENQELSFCEFKTHKANKKMLDYQESKTLASVFKSQRGHAST